MSAASRVRSSSVAGSRMALSSSVYGGHIEMEGSRSFIVFSDGNVVQRYLAPKVGL